MKSRIQRAYKKACKTAERKWKESSIRSSLSGIVVLLLLAFGILSLPNILAYELQFKATEAAKPPFPVTVDPTNKRINEDPSVDALFGETSPTLSAAAILGTEMLGKLANLVTAIPGYELLAGSSIVFAEIRPGYREEEVARTFGLVLGWTKSEQQAFLKRVRTIKPTLTEGSFVPGTYMVSAAASPAYIQELLADRYERDVAGRYPAHIQEVLPLHDVLTLASLLQRETRDPAEMRIISGILWNRLWIGMNLQIDATLQYAKASTQDTKTWWPVPRPADKYIDSPYNTYQNKGLPPGPIANPSTEAILAALNPKNTDCFFYFHDSKGGFHCSPDYEGHVQLLRKHYGQGR